MVQDVISDGYDLKKYEQLPAREVPVGALSPGLYLRQGGTNAAHVRLLIDAAGTAELPPILVQEDGWRVIDGLHRLEAAKLGGQHHISARFLDCTDSEALVLAMKSNSAHGLPLSKADRVAGAEQVLTGHPDWSDRAIAGITGLSAKTIAALRNQSAGGGAHIGGKRLGLDGKLRPVIVGEGRRRVAEYVNAHPDAPLRQIARETDVSLGTVHDVTARLRRSASPEHNGHPVPAGRLAVHQVNGVAGTVAVGPDVISTPLGRRNHTDAPRTWAGIAANVASDPTIRYTDSGKCFYRWMALHAAHSDGWRDFVETIPAHWLDVIAPIADSIGKEWTLFAERLRSRQQAGGRHPDRSTGQ